ncbi:MAG TPA: DUF4157 domain-containing protein, partial [Longimicrobium sp.]|uniref:DUF4157 domain-containing protein n=1 Tax=Longimicrobium sp. TaxID=2029185 RepID=UPI002ED7B0E1
MMAALSETRPAAAPVLRRAPAAAGGRCSCGGTVGPDGMCDKCRQRAQRQAASAGATPALAPPAVHDVLRRPGAPLDGRVRSAMEPRFGHGFGDVRVHADGAAADSARAVSAHAYTVGPRIVFGAGRYAPGTPSGDRLIAHELAHVVQQRGSAPAIQHQLEIGAVDDPAERQADAAADQVMRGGRAEVRPGSAGTSLARQPAPSPAPS